MEQNPENASVSPIAPPSPQTAPVASGLTRQQRTTIAALSAVALLVLAGLTVLTVFLVRAGGETTAQVRDIFIILMALEFFIIGLALIILIVQLAILINLLQTEVRPILDSTNETVNTLRGTAAFLSDNLVEPVIKLNQYLASIKRLLDIVRPR